MDTDKLISRGAIAVPLVHVVTCGIYIAGYATGFGGRIGGLFSASDFFTVTIQHLAMVYVTGLGFPLVYTLLRARSEAAQHARDRDTGRDEQAHQKAIAVWKGIELGLKIGLPLIGVCFFVILMLQIWTGSIRYFYVNFLGMWIGTLPFWWRFAEKARFYGSTFQFLWIGATFAISVLGMAMGAGDRDRRLAFSDLKPGRMLCKKHVILSSIGDRFITVTSDNARHIVNDECEVFADLEKVPIARAGPLAELVTAKVRAWSAEWPSKRNDKRTDRPPVDSDRIENQSSNFTGGK